MSPPVVTASDSHSQASPASRNGCPKCKQYDRECECAWCHGPLPDGHRSDRRYCSSSCRARASMWRSSPEGEAAIQRWREEAADRLYALKLLTEMGPKPDTERLARHAAAVRSGENCAECGAELGDVVWWRSVETGVRGDAFESHDERRAAPVCENCRCGFEFHKAWLCGRCRPAGSSWGWDRGSGSYRVAHWVCGDPARVADRNAPHNALYCERCHPKSWDEGRCPGCERTVMFREKQTVWQSRRWRNREFDWQAAMNHALRNGLDHDAAEQFCIDAEKRWCQFNDGKPIAYCSRRCRARFAAASAAERAPDRGPVLCEGCREVMDGQRADAQYCSSACRQRAYRRRSKQ